jgi:hypothetical protein
MVHNNPIEHSAELESDVNFEKRLQTITIFLIVIGSVVAMIFGGSKMAAGCLLGGALSLFNERWLSASTKAILEFASSTGNPSVPRAMKFFFRLIVVALIIGIAAKSGYFHLLGLGCGFSTFVGAAMIEAFYQAFNSQD